jgi:ribosome-associated protein
VEEFVLSAPYITLGQLLKRMGMIETGGQAKAFLLSEDVRVNGEPESRRGRKLVSGDIVAVAGQKTVKIIGQP